jgi:hypothetical protein
LLLGLGSSKMRCRSTFKPVPNNCRYNKATAYEEQIIQRNQAMVVGDKAYSTDEQIESTREAKQLNAGKE